MREQIDISYSEINGTPKDLISQAEEAIKAGATNYNTMSGKIVFFRLQDELEYLQDLEKKIGVNLKTVKYRIKQIREGKV